MSSKQPSSADTTAQQFPEQRDTGAVTPASAVPGGEVQEVAGLLRALYQYLASNLPVHPSLAPAVAALYAPAESYRLGNIALAQAQAIGVYQLVNRLRTVEPSLPVP